MLNRIEKALLKAGGVGVFQDPYRVVFTFNNAEDANELYKAFCDVMNRKYEDNEE